MSADERCTIDADTSDADVIEADNTDADTSDADTSDAETHVGTHTAPSVGAWRVAIPPVYTSDERVGLFALIAALFFIAWAAAGSTLLGVAAGAALAASVGSAMRSLAADDTQHRVAA